MPHIFDPSLLEQMTQIEGERWRKQQLEQPQSPYNLPVWQAAWKAKADYCKDNPEYENEPVSSFIDGPGGDGAIYGDGGWNRYAVRADGEVVLLKWSASEASREKAARLGFRLA